MELILPDISKWYKVKVVQTVLPIFCNLSFSKYIRLALPDFNKYGVFDRNYMWLELSQF